MKTLREILQKYFYMHEGEFVKLEQAESEINEIMVSRDDVLKVIGEMDNSSRMGGIFTAKDLKSEIAKIGRKP